MSEPLVVPIDALSSDALEGLIEEYVSRDGTDYGEMETPMYQRIAQIKRALRDNTAVVLFDSDSQTTHIAPRDWVKR